MGLDQVIADVRRDGDSRAQQVLAGARKEAEAILAAARAQAAAYEKARLDAAEREAAAAKAQAASRGESEARRAVLAAEADLRASLREQVLAHFAKLDAKTRATHVTALIATAKAVIPAGKVWGSDKDANALKGQTVYKAAGSLPGAGGIVVESEDGKARLDLTYETLLDGMWRDVLKAEAALFR